MAANRPEEAQGTDEGESCREGWHRIGGSTTNGRGSEGGVIFRDEEHHFGARITLERDCDHGVPVSVTCGIYGWFFHTRFLGSIAEAKYELMQEELEGILDSIRLNHDPNADAKRVRTSERIQAFVEKFP
jgi:hypothetical protein